MLIKFSFLFLLIGFLTSCGKVGALQKVTPVVVPNLNMNEYLQVKNEQRALNEDEVKLVKSVCETFKSKRLNFNRYYRGKRFFYDLDSNTCNGVISEKKKVPLIMMISLSGQLTYQIDRGPFQNQRYFFKEESDTDGVLVDYCLKLLNPDTQNGDLSNIALYNNGAKKLQIETISSSKVRIRVGTFEKQENREELKIITSDEIQVLMDESLGKNLKGLVIEQRSLKICPPPARLTKYEEIHSLFSNIETL